MSFRFDWNKNSLVTGEFLQLFEIKKLYSKNENTIMKI